MIGTPCFVTATGSEVDFDGLSTSGLLCPEGISFFDPAASAGAVLVYFSLRFSPLVST